MLKKSYLKPDGHLILRFRIQMYIYFSVRFNICVSYSRRKFLFYILPRVYRSNGIVNLFSFVFVVVFRTRLSGPTSYTPYSVIFVLWEKYLLVPSLSDSLWIATTHNIIIISLSLLVVTFVCITRAEYLCFKKKIFRRASCKFL